MYLRLTRARVDPANVDRVNPLAGEVTAAVKRLPGLRHVHQGVDRATGTIVAVSTWDTEEHARFSRETLGGDIMTKLREAGVRFDPPEIYELVDG